MRNMAYSLALVVAGFVSYLSWQFDCVNTTMAGFECALWKWTTGIAAVMFGLLALAILISWWRFRTSSRHTQNQ